MHITDELLMNTHNIYFDRDKNIFLYIIPLLYRAMKSKYHAYKHWIVARGIL